MEGNHPILSFVTSSSVVHGNTDPFDMSLLRDEVNTESLERDVSMEENPVSESCEMLSAAATVSEILQLEEVDVPSIKASYVPHPRGGEKMKLLHKNGDFELHCPCLKVRVLDACDKLAMNLFKGSGSESNWRHVVVRHDKYTNYPKVRINIPTLVDGNVAQYATEMYQKEGSGTMQKLVFSKFDPEELEPWLNPGTFLDAYLFLDTYDYQNRAGIE
ncbi:unnamed protein product [Linum tenue]|uniref:Uncharacterized protein n=1 Tax=Linum tenue TaxID=586396 RepID=A0AAV0LM49_9ROSI|nr:unnamed protein product [Linum tenue]